MKLILKLYFPALLLVLSGSKTNAQSFDFSKPDSMNVEQIHEGAKHFKYTYNSVPWNVNVVEVDLTNDQIYISTAKGMDRISDSREKLSQIVERKNGIDKKIIAAINADFFYSNGDIVNNQISQGEFVKGISTRRSQFAISYSKEPSIEVYNFHSKFSSRYFKDVTIDACNFKRGIDSIVIFNHYWGETTKTGGNGIEYKLKPIDSIKSNSTFRAVITEINDSNSTITDNNYILSLSGNAAQKIKMLALSDTLTITLGLLPATEPIRELFGGIPQIVRGGINIANEQSKSEKASNNILNNRHPRTAIGYNKDKTKIYMVTVDGRQKISAGMTLNELSEFMLFIGCNEALNLDGGGSTTMIINNKIVNFPSDVVGERKIGNVLLLMTK